MEAATSRWNTEGSRERAPSLDVGEPRSRGAPSLRREGEKPRWAGAGAVRRGRERGGARTRGEAGLRGRRGRDREGGGTTAPCEVGPTMRGVAKADRDGRGRAETLPGQIQDIGGGAGEGRSR